MTGGAQEGAGGLPAGGGGAAAVRPDGALRLIAVYKFCKTALLLVIGLGTLRLLDPDVAAWADHWAAALALRHDRRVLAHVIGFISGLSPGRIHALAAGAFAVALLFLVEGVGLWRGKRWAQYLTIVATTVFVPFEIVGLARLITVTRATALVVNLAVVVFLVYHLRRSQAARAA